MLSIGTKSIDEKRVQDFETDELLWMCSKQLLFVSDNNRRIRIISSLLSTRCDCQTNNIQSFR
jgi:hypothetical protein